MNTKTIWAIIGAIIILGVAGYLVASKPSASTSVTNYSWEFKDLGEDSTGMPTTEVVLTAGNTTLPVGTFNGSCAVIEGSSWQLQEGEKTGVICWWAGGGEEVGVFEDPSTGSGQGRLVVKKGQLDEGDAETPGFRGNFQTFVTL